MSRLNDLDCDRAISTSMQLYNVYKELRSHLFNTGRIPKDELKLLVVTTYNAEVITEGKACEILNCNRIEFRKMINEFI
jgi:hypothetical protein